MICGITSNGFRDGRNCHFLFSLYDYQTKLTGMGFLPYTPILFGKKLFTVNVPNKNRVVRGVDSSLLFAAIFRNFKNIFTYLSRGVLPASNDAKII
jgi:hypothetical protein